MKLHIQLLLLLLTSLPRVISASSNSNKKKDAILLSTVQSLTLRSDLRTTHRRVSSLPQLSCVGGNAKGLYEIDVLRCRNSGSGYGEQDVEWTCKASLPPEFKLGSTEVICEGYDSAEDEYVLKGSCGVEYRLVLTSRGEERWPERVGQWGLRGETGERVKNWGWRLGLAGFLVWILYRAWFGQGGGQRRGGDRRGGGGGGGWGWGGGDDGGNDPPPPYTPRPPKPRSSYSRPSADWGAGAGQSTQNWRPGFWTGAATGAAAGYAASNLRGGARAGNAQAGPSNWFGGGQQNTRAGPSRSSDNNSYGSSRYESTGFGSTSRR